MTKVYIAAPWGERFSSALHAKRVLEEKGALVVSDWIDRDLGADVDTKQEAVADLVQVGDCDLFVLLNTQKRGEETSGKAVEFGAAITLGKRCVVVGESTNIFHLLDEVEHVERVGSIEL